MEVASARQVNLKEKGRFEHNNENGRIDKYTLSDELPARLASIQLHSMRPAYHVRKVHPCEKKAILEFLRRFFFHDEPLNQAVQLVDTPEGRCVELEEYATTTLDENVSVAAYDDDGEIVGIVINGIVKREDYDNSDKSAGCPNEKFARILKLLTHLDLESRIWEKLPASCDKLMEVRIASTHDKWRGKGLMRVLCEESERIAKSLNAGAMRMDATSAFSAAAAERLGYKKIYSVQYKDLEYAPKPEAPHLEARVYLKEL